MTSAQPVADRPYRSLRISLWDRISLHRHARSDARQWLPGSASGRALLPPTYFALSRHSDEVIEAERVSACDDNAAARLRMAECASRLALHAGREPESMPQRPSPGELSTRRRGEETAPEDLVIARKLSKFERSVASTRARLGAVRAEAESLQVEMDSLQESIRIREDAARVRALRFKDHSERRLAHYLRVLARKHDDGPAVVALAAGLRINHPRWVDGEPLLISETSHIPTELEEAR